MQVRRTGGTYGGRFGEARGRTRRKSTLSLRLTAALVLCGIAVAAKLAMPERAAPVMAQMERAMSVQVDAKELTERIGRALEGREELAAVFHSLLLPERADTQSAGEENLRQEMNRRAWETMSRLCGGDEVTPPEDPLNGGDAHG